VCVVKTHNEGFLKRNRYFIWLLQQSSQLRKLPLASGLHWSFVISRHQESGHF